jgi:hypothetical protein
MENKEILIICLLILIATSILIRMEIAETWMALIWSATLFYGLLKLLKK